MQTFMVPCLLGLEKLVGDEIRRLGLRDVQVENGRVLCRGQLSDIARLNINLRCGARVLLVLGRFPARSFEELFQGTRAIAWEDYLPRDAAFPVKGYSISSQLHAVPACQSIIKKDEGSLRPGAVPGGRGEASGAVLPVQGRGHDLSGYLRRGPV